MRLNSGDNGPKFSRIASLTVRRHRETSSVRYRGRRHKTPDSITPLAFGDTSLTVAGLSELHEHRS